jgi:hypothetical protein
MTLAIDIPEPQVTSIVPEGRSARAELSEFYRQVGFEAGYAQAARDQLEYSVAIAEQVLREHNYANGGGDPRRLLYAFIAKVDRRLSLFANPTISECDVGYMEGGLGI